MKKIYVNPVTEVQFVESTALMQTASMGVYSDETTTTPLSREIFDDRLFDEK